MSEPQCTNCQVLLKQMKKDIKRISALEQRVKELENESEHYHAHYDAEMLNWNQSIDLVRQAEIRIKELESYDNSKSEKFIEIGDRYESLKFKMFDLQEQLENYKSHYEATLANWNITLDKLKKLQEAVNRHEQFKRSHERVISLEDEELYRAENLVLPGINQKR